MALTVKQFKNEYPQFRQTDEALVSAKLAAAGRRIGALWADRADDGQGLLAAHLLSIAPGGENARLQKDMGKTIYQDEYEQMKLEITFGFRNT